MQKSKFRFIEENTIPQSISVTSFEKELDSIGKELSEYAQGYFYHSVSTFPKPSIKEAASLLITIPTLGYSYRVLTISKEDDGIQVRFHTLDEDVSETKTVQNNQELADAVEELMYSQKAHEIFKFLIETIKEEETASNGNNIQDSQN